MIEFGIEWEHGDGRTHIGGEYTLEGARRMLAGAGDRRKWDPHAARVVERDVSDWRDAAEMPAAQGDSAPKSSGRSGRLGAQVKTAPALRQQRDPGPNPAKEGLMTNTIELPADNVGQGAH